MIQPANTLIQAPLSTHSRCCLVRRHPALKKGKTSVAAADWPDRLTDSCGLDDSLARPMATTAMVLLETLLAQALARSCPCSCPCPGCRMGVKRPPLKPKLWTAKSLVRKVPSKIDSCAFSVSQFRSRLWVSNHPSTLTHLSLFRPCNQSCLNDRSFSFPCLICLLSDRLTLT